jgi:hypothetical protein
MGFKVQGSKVKVKRQGRDELAVSAKGPKAIKELPIL